MHKPIEIEVEQTGADRILAEHTFADNFYMPVENDLSLEDAARQVFDTSPAWIEKLLWLRNVIVSPLGLKGTAEKEKILQNASTEEIFGFFPVVNRNEGELVLGFDDAHLDFRIRIYFEVINNQKGVCATTLVKAHNIWGRGYMFFVKPFHRVIVPTMLRQLKTTQQQ